MGLEHILYNIKITYGYHKDRPDNMIPIAIVGNIDFINDQNIRYKESCENYTFSRDLYIMETDFILVKSEEGVNFVESFELKSSRKKSPYNYNIQRQLLKQALILGISVMKDLIISINNLCLQEDLFGENKNLILNIKYLNGTEENSIKKMDLKDKIKYAFRNGRLISNIIIEGEESDFDVRFHFVFDRFVYVDRFRIPFSNLDSYLSIVFREYNRIVDLFLSSSRRIVKKENPSLIDILNSFLISQKTFQAQER